MTLHPLHGTAVFPHTLPSPAAPESRPRKHSQTQAPSTRFYARGWRKDKARRIDIKNEYSIIRPVCVKHEPGALS